MAAAPPLPVNARAGWGALAAVGAMAAIEAAYFLPDPSVVRRIAAWAWLATAVGMLAFAAGVAVVPWVRRAFWSRPGRWWYAAATTVPLLLLYFGVTGTVWTPFSPEGVAQNVVGVELLRHDPDLGVYSAGYNARYVARQYALAALPTLAFGPSFAALRVGNSLVYVIGYVAFLAALAGFLDARKVDGLFWSAWAGTVVSLGYYPLMVARMFEQTVMPLGATLLVAAALLHYLPKPTGARSLWVAWALGFLTAGYTPAYATWALAAGTLVYLILRGPGHKVLVLALAHGLVALVVAGLILRHAGQLAATLAAGSQGLTAAGWLWRYVAGFAAVFNSGVSLLPAPLGLAALAVLAVAGRRRDRRVLGVLLWCAAVVLASLTLVGSWFDQPASEIHRAMVVLPVIAAGVVGYGADQCAGAMNDGRLRKLAACGMVYMFGTAVWIPLLNRWRVVDGREMTDFDEAALHLSAVAHDRRLPAIADLTVVPPLNLNTFDLAAGLAYFFPGARFLQDAAPIPGPGAYTLAYNDQPRDPDYRSAAKRERTYLELRPVPASAEFLRSRRRIEQARGLVADYWLADGAGRLAADHGGNVGPAQLEGAAARAADAVDLPGRDALLGLPGLPVASRALTVALWVKWAGGAGEQGLLKLGTPVAGSTCLYLCNGADHDRLRLSLDTPVPPNLAEHAEIDAPRLPVGQWTLVTVELTGEEAILWIGAAQAGGVRVPLEDPDLLRENHNWVGRSLAGPADFQGKIARLRIYDRALSGEEIATLAGERTR